MLEDLIARLGPHTAEEAAILAGSAAIDRSLYMDGSRDVITADKLLPAGRQIAMRPHTRFVHFPPHTHDYVEMVYMCRGRTTHIINGDRIELQEGELLMLGQNAIQEILPASETDIAVNFIVRPAFFAGALEYLGDEETPLRRFLLDCLCGGSEEQYLCFRVSALRPVQNLMENLLRTFFDPSPNRRGIQQLTLSLLFVQLVDHTEALMVPSPSRETVWRVLRYVEESYRDGSLGQIAQELHYEIPALSRLIKQKTGQNFTELIQEKRLSQAAWLLRNTARRIDDIAQAVGYENVSYFHRLFLARFGLSPRRYRLGASER